MMNSYPNTTDLNDTENEPIPFIQTSSFIQKGNGDIKRKRNKDSYIDIKLEQDNYIQDIVKIPGLTKNNLLSLSNQNNKSYEWNRTHFTTFKWKHFSKSMTLGNYSNNRKSFNSMNLSDRNSINSKTSMNQTTKKNHSTVRKTNKTKNKFNKTQTSSDSSKKRVTKKISEKDSINKNSNQIQSKCKFSQSYGNSNKEYLQTETDDELAHLLKIKNEIDTIIKSKLSSNPIHSKMLSGKLEEILNEEYNERRICQSLPNNNTASNEKTSNQTKVRFGTNSTSDFMKDESNTRTYNKMGELLPNSSIKSNQENDSFNNQKYFNIKNNSNFNCIDSIEDLHNQINKVNDRIENENYAKENHPSNSNIDEPLKYESIANDYNQNNIEDTHHQIKEGCISKGKEQSGQALLKTKNKRNVENKQGDSNKHDEKMLKSQKYSTTGSKKGYTETHDENFDNSHKQEINAHGNRQSSTNEVNDQINKKSERIEKDSLAETRIKSQKHNTSQDKQGYSNRNDENRDNPYKNDPIARDNRENPGNNFNEQTNKESDRIENDTPKQSKLKSQSRSTKVNQPNDSKMQNEILDESNEYKVTPRKQKQINTNCEVNDQINKKKTVLGQKTIKSQSDNTKVNKSNNVNKQEDAKDETYKYDRENMQNPIKESNGQTNKRNDTTENNSLQETRLKSQSHNTKVNKPNNLMNIEVIDDEYESVEDRNNQFDNYHQSNCSTEKMTAKKRQSSNYKTNSQYNEEHQLKTGNNYIEDDSQEEQEDFKQKNGNKANQKMTEVPESKFVDSKGNSYDINDIYQIIERTEQMTIKSEKHNEANYTDLFSDEDWSKLIKFLDKYLRKHEPKNRRKVNSDSVIFPIDHSTPNKNKLYLKLLATLRQFRRELIDQKKNSIINRRTHDINFAPYTSYHSISNSKLVKSRLKEINSRLYHSDRNIIQNEARFTRNLLTETKPMKSGTMFKIKNSPEKDYINYNNTESNYYINKVKKDIKSYSKLKHVLNWKYEIRSGSFNQKTSPIENSKFKSIRSQCMRVMPANDLHINYFH